MKRTTIRIHPELLLWGRLAATLFGVLLVVVACSSEIGDDCSVNFDCSPSGDRICDTAQPGGYCTVEGCGSETCPEEAVCVGFFPASFLSTACDPKTEDAVSLDVEATDDCLPDERCLSGGYCALFSLERRFCMKTCGDDDDCRSGYECRRAGLAGSEAVLAADNTSAAAIRFCAKQLR